MEVSIYVYTDQEIITYEELVSKMIELNRQISDLKKKEN